MTGAERVLYRLPYVMAAETVWILEGEKDVENMVALGFEATCNVGGAGKWMDGYTETLAGKNVILCGDNDKPGQEHIKKVFDSIAGKAKTVKIVKVPSACKDASDFIATFASPELARCAFDEMAMEATPFVDGIKLPVYTMAEIEPKYKRQATETASLCLDLGSWLPTFRNRVRPLIPGDFALVIAGTGVGKTNILQNIWLHSAPLKTHPTAAKPQRCSRLQSSPATRPSGVRRVCNARRYLRSRCHGGMRLASCGESVVWCRSCRDLFNCVSHCK